MKIISKKAAAMAYAIVVSMLLFLLAAALLPIASGLTDFTRNGTDQKISYIDAKSSIEYAKAVLYYKLNTTGQSVGSFYVSGAPNSDGVIQFAYTNGTPAGSTPTYAVCTYDDTTKDITIEANTSRLGYQSESLTYTTVYTPPVPTGTFTEIPDYIQIGRQYGDNAILVPLSNGTDQLDCDVLIKDTLDLYSNTSTLKLNSLKGIYFTADPSVSATYGSVELDASTYYFGGDLNGLVRYTYKHSAWQSEVLSDINLKPRTGNSNPTYIYFDNVTITLNPEVSFIGPGPKTITLNGYYSFTGNQFNLFDVDNLMSHITPVAAATAQPSFNPVILNALATNTIGNYVSGEDVGWVKDGYIFYFFGGSALPSDQTGKTVFAYVEHADIVYWYSNLNYKADSIILKSDAGRWYVGNDGSIFPYIPDKTDITFTCNYICFDFDGDIRKSNSNSHFYVCSPVGVTQNVLVHFEGTTVFENSSGSAINTVPAGTYLCPSGTDFFATGLMTKLIPYTGGTGGTGSTGGSFGEALYIR